MGRLVFHKSSVAVGGASAADFNLVSADAGTTAVWVDGKIRQVVSAKFIIDLVEDGGAVEARAYDISVKGAADVAGVFAVSGDPLVVYRFTGLLADGNGLSGVGLVKTLQGFPSQSWELRANGGPVGRSWKAVEPDGVITEGVEVVQPDYVGGWTRTVDVVRKAPGPSAQILSKEVSQYTSGVVGEVLLSMTEGLGAATRTTTYEYYAYNAGATEFPQGFPEPVKGKLRSKISSDGSWEKYDYDVLGGVIGIYRPWLDGPASPNLATTSNCRYTLVQGEDRTEKILGNEISTTTVINTVLAQVQIPGGSNEPFSGNIYRHSSSGSSLDSASYNSSSQSTLSVSQDGSATFQSKEETGTWNAGTGVFTLDTGTSIGNAKRSWRANVYRDFSSTGRQYKMEPLKTMRTMTIEVDRNVVFEEQQVLATASSWESVSATGYSYDSDGRQIAMGRNLELLSTTVYDSLLSKTVSDATQGTQTQFTTSVDGLTETQRQIGVPASAGVAAIPDLTTVTTRSGPSLTQTTTTVTTAGTSSRTSSTSQTSDVLGRTVSSTDARGRITTYAYPDAFTTVETAPGNIVTTTTLHSDGQLKSIVSSSGTSQHYTYSVSAGLITTRTGSSAGPSPVRWNSSTVDGLGRVVSEARSGPNGNTITVTYGYDAEGRRTSITTPGLAPRLTEYNLYGEAYREGMDVNSNGLLDETGSDPLTETETTFSKIGGYWWRQTVKRIWVENGAGTVETTSTNTWLAAGAGGQIETTDRFGNIKTYLTWVINDSTIWKVTVDSFNNFFGINIYVRGRLVSSMEPNVPGTITYTHDDFGRPHTVTHPHTGLNTTLYNNFDQPISVTDALGKTTSYDYYPDGHINAGQLKSITQPATSPIYQAYDVLGNLTHTWGGTYPVRYEYNGDGQKIFMHTYRDFGPTSDTLPAAFSADGDKTEWQYQAATGLLTSKIDAAGKAVTYTYTNEGLPLTRAWARGVTTTYSHNSLGLVAAIDYSDGTPDISRTYDRAGKPLTVSGGPGGTRIYDRSGPVSETYSGGVLDGVVITDAMDIGRPAGQTLTIGGQTAATTAYGYLYAGGQLETAVLQSGSQTITTTYGYHATRGALETTVTALSSHPAITTTQIYDVAGRLQSIQTTGVGGAVISGKTYQRDDAGKITRATQSGGDYWAYGYDQKSQVTSGRRHQSGGTVLNGFASTYDYDDIGNRKNWQAVANPPGVPAALVTGHTTNSLNQYSGIINPSTRVVVGEAADDAVVTINNAPTTRQGKWFSAAITGDNSNGSAWLPVSVKATKAGGGANGANLTKTTTGGLYLPPANESPTYDEDGNLLSDGEWSYTWDAENRLLAMQTHPVAVTAGIPNRRVEYQYDADSRRISRTERKWDSTTSQFLPDPSPVRYVWKNWTLLAEVTSSGSGLTVQKTYLWGLDLAGSLDQTGNVGNLLAIVDQTTPAQVVTLLPSYDSNGNIVALSDGNTATRLAAYEYDAFGNQVLRTNHAALAGKPAALVAAVERNVWGFSTKPEDPATGLLYYGYRYYDPVTGRWPSRDPIGEEGGVNLYGFVGNNPIWNIDYLGLVIKEKCVFEVVGGHANQVGDAEKNFEKDKEKTPCNRFYGAACFRSPDGGLVWPTPESRDERGQPGNATIGEELMRQIQQGEKDAPKECEDEKTCCSSIELKVRCQPSPSMQTARDKDPLAKRACNYGNTYDCKSKKWSKPLFK